MRPILPVNASLICLKAAAVVAMAQAPPLPPEEKGTVSASGKFQPATPAAGEHRSQDAGVKRIGEHTFEIGRVIRDAQQRTVAFPARLNMRNGVIEYVLVTPEGKEHEALLTTEAAPQDIHIACLLLGLAEAKLEGEPNKDVAVPTGNAVTIEVTWETNGPRITRPLEQLIGCTTERPGSGVLGTLAPGPWFYNGSVVSQTGFTAQQEGSVISLIRDPFALVNNPRADRDNDDMHAPNEAALPPDHLPLKVVFRFPPTPATK